MTQTLLITDLAQTLLLATLSLAILYTLRLFRRETLGALDDINALHKWRETVETRLTALETHLPAKK